MKKILALASVVVCSSVVCAADHADIAAKADGYYDVTLTTKRLAHSEKTVTKTFTTSNRKGSAVDQFFAAQEIAQKLAGYKEIQISADGKLVVDPKSIETSIKKITFKYSYFDYKVTKVTEEGNTDYITNYITKVVSESDKGVYDAETGKVYLWNTAAATKISAKSTDVGTLIEDPKMKKGEEVAQSGYVAYEVPLKMDKQFIATDDNKAAGGFIGANNKGKDGTELNFAGFTAFGTGTLKNDELYSVAGNVAMKDPTDIKFGAYGTWKLQKDMSKKTAEAGDIKAVLRNKGCVEMIEEAGL